MSPALVYPFMRSVMEAPFPAPGRTITVKSYLPGAGDEVSELMLKRFNSCQNAGLTLIEFPEASGHNLPFPINSAEYVLVPQSTGETSS